MSYNPTQRRFNRDKFPLFSPYGTVWLVREEVEQVEHNGVYRIVVTFTSGDTKAVKYDSTAHMLQDFEEVKEWIGE